MVGFFSLHSVVNAQSSAKLYLTSGKTTYNIGDTITVEVKVDAQSESINAVEGKVSFPTDTLEFLDFTRIGSVFGIWPIEPKESENKGVGTIVFGGGVPSPGFVGKNGLVLKMNFRARALGVVELSIQSAKVLANDGFGIDILKSTAGLRIVIRVREGGVQKPVTSPQPSAIMPKDTAPPEIISADFLEAIPTTNPKPVFEIRARDLESGIDGFSIIIGSDKEIFFKTNEITLPYQAYGAHTMKARAFDRAGNMAEVSREFKILPIEPPVLIVYPSTLSPLEESLYIEGTTALPDEKVLIYAVSEGVFVKTFAARSNGDKEFILKERVLLESGDYDFFARAVDNQGAISPESNVVKIKVVFNALRLGPLVIKYSLLVLILLAVIIILMIIFAVIELRHHRRKKSLAKDYVGEQKNIYQSLEKMREILEESLKKHEEKKASLESIARLRKLEKILHEFRHLKE